MPYVKRARNGGRRRRGVGVRRRTGGGRRLKMDLSNLGPLPVNDLYGAGAVQFGRMAADYLPGGSRAKRARSRSGSGLSAASSFTRAGTSIMDEVDGGNGAVHQWRVKKIVTGTPYRNGANKLMAASLSKYIFRWNGIKTFDTHGLFWLSDKDYGGGVRGMPYMIYDLTAINNNFNGAIVKAEPCRRAELLTNGSFQFAISGAPDATGVITSESTKLQQEFGTKGASAADAVLSSSVLKWADMKMNFWGARNKPVKFSVQLVQFKDQALQPENGPNGLRDAYLEGNLKPYLYNPLSVTAPRKDQHVKVLHQYEFVLQPSHTTDNDPDPEVRTVHWFHHFGKICSYRQHENTLETAAAVADNAAYAVSVGGASSVTLTSDERVYLVVRASAFTALDSTTADNNLNHASWDLCVRTCHEKLG